ncbi:MAG: hypothetical protein K0R69_925 [Clostridia bacterium]|jgi:hypothetical protein|nr:hypothetical protein [Clostridia bacterium]
MTSKLRHYRVVSRNKDSSPESLLTASEAHMCWLSCIGLLIWFFGIAIGYILSHNK